MIIQRLDFRIGEGGSWGLWECGILRFDCTARSTELCGVQGVYGAL
jgi:hypothetical protein